MEDPDVIKRAQLPLAFREWQNCCTGKRAKRHDHGRGGNIRIYLYDGSYEQLHIPYPRRALLYRNFWTIANLEKYAKDTVHRNNRGCTARLLRTNWVRNIIPISYMCS